MAKFVNIQNDSADFFKFIFSVVVLDSYVEVLGILQKNQCLHPTYQFKQLCVICVLIRDLEY
jgi:hypothetical protein